MSSSSSFSVTTHEALADNLMYLIADESTKLAAVVDPVEPQKLVSAATAAGLTIVASLTTHHHFDHAGGNNELKQLVPSVEIVGGDSTIQGLTKQVSDADAVRVGNLEVRCVHTPAHTSGHISYLVGSAAGSQPMAVFTGDSLFVGGCGRFFEGTPEQMVATTTKFSALPPDTLVYVGHECEWRAGTSPNSNLPFAETNKTRLAGPCTCTHVAGKPRVRTRRRAHTPMTVPCSQIP